MITKRRYKILADFERVHKFLTETFDIHCTLLPQYFEYAHMHAQFNYFKSHHIGIWEEVRTDGSLGKIVGIACYEMTPGENCHLHTHKDYKYLLPELLQWAELELYAVKDGKKVLEIEIGEEPEKRELLKSAGYLLSWSGPVKIFPYDKTFPERRLPKGFTLINGINVDYVKLHHCFYKGFDHGDNINDEDADRRIFACNAPNADLSLWTFAVAPDGEYACGLGMWFDKTNKYAYLEPLATVPKYRRMGLATVCLTEAMKKTKTLGAKYCFGGDREFYTDIGFETVMTDEAWKKVW